MRKLMWFTVGFGGACAFGAYCGTDWLASVALLIGALAVCTMILCRYWKKARIGAAVLIGLCAGCAMFAVYDRMYPSNAEGLNGKTQHVTMIVRDYSFDTAYGTACDATVEISGKHYKVRVYLNEKMDVEPGNRLIGPFSFKKTTGSGVDEVLYHRGEGIFLTASQKGNVTIERCWSTPWRDLPAVFRQELKNTLWQHFPEDTFGFAKALLLGDRTDVDYATETAFKVSGISHIIAVSGLHVSILFGLVTLVSGRRRILTAAIGIPVVLLFAAVVGFTPSITRAAVMQILIMIALLVRREYDMPTALSFAALVMLVANPLVITSVSYQLSFACMAGISAFAEPIQLWMLDPKRFGRFDCGIVRFVSSGIAVSISSGALTAPFVAMYFGAVSLVGVITNLLTLWMISFIFYGVMAVCLTAIFAPAVAAALAALVSCPIRYVLTVSRALASIPLAAVYTKSIYIVLWLVAAYVLLGTFLLAKKRAVPVFGALTGLLLILSIGLSWAEARVGAVRLTVLDVGQGQSLILQCGEKSYLVDCGAEYGDSAADTAAESLLSMGIFRLDGVILTHYDLDHAGGIPYLMERIEVAQLYLPYCHDDTGMKDILMTYPCALLVEQDMQVNLEIGSLHLYAPESYNSGNDSSMCILLESEKCDILVTGDRSEAGERLLLKYHDLPDVDVLIAGHHGAKDSTSSLLLDTVKPEYVMISAGENNRYGHPAPQLLQRLWEYGCRILRTDENGTILFWR